MTEEKQKPKILLVDVREPPVPSPKDYKTFEEYFTGDLHKHEVHAEILRAKTCVDAHFLFSEHKDIALTVIYVTDRKWVDLTKLFSELTSRAQNPNGPIIATSYARDLADTVGGTHQGYLLEHLGAAVKELLELAASQKSAQMHSGQPPIRPKSGGTFPGSNGPKQ